MRDKYGIILLDRDELIIQIYEKQPPGNFIKIYNRLYDFATFSSKKSVTPGEIVEIVAQTALSKEAINVMDWKICSRNVPELLVSQVSYATNIKSETLTLTREQNLICQGVVIEF